jgi:hypothetical protein
MPAITVGCCLAMPAGWLLARPARSAADAPQIDCEMTGLETTDRIIEIAVIITDGRLREVDEGIEFVIQTPKEVLDG